MHDQPRNKTIWIQVLAAAIILEPRSIARSGRCRTVVIARYCKVLRASYTPALLANWWGQHIHLCPYSRQTCLATQPWSRNLCISNALPLLTLNLTVLSCSPQQQFWPFRLNFNTEAFRSCCTTACSRSNIAICECQLTHRPTKHLERSMEKLDCQRCNGLSQFLHATEIA